MLCQLFSVFIVIFLTITQALGSPITQKKQTHEPKIICLIEDQQGNVILEKDSKKRFNPASTLKLLTSLVALRCLGEDYRFKTEFYLSSQNDLKIKGYGDPVLISEIWNRLAKKISEKVKAINNILIDDSFFSRAVKIPGVGNSLNPYDAPVGALCVNFNTIYVKKTKDNRFISAEPQTPLIQFALRQIKKMHIKETGRYVISHKTTVAEMYAGELFKYFLKECGVSVKGKVGFGAVNPEDKLIYVYYSDYPLKEVIRKMMKYSNNFIANQITLILGAEFYGPPATLEKGISVIKEYAKRKLGLKGISIVEGSGISRHNFISCQDMIIILKKFAPYMKLLKRKANLYYKTGTLKGIATRAGYIIKGKKIYSFVLFLRGDPQTADQILLHLSHMSHSASFNPEDLMVR